VNENLEHLRPNRSPYLGASTFGRAPTMESSTDENGRSARSVVQAQNSRNRRRLLMGGGPPVSLCAQRSEEKGAVVDGFIA